MGTTLSNPESVTNEKLVVNTKVASMKKNQDKIIRSSHSAGGFGKLQRLGS